MNTAARRARLGERHPSFNYVELYHFRVIDALVIASCTITLHPRSQITRSSIFVNCQQSRLIEVARWHRLNSCGGRSLKDCSQQRGLTCLPIV